MIKLNPIKSEKIWGYELWLASTHENGCQKDFFDTIKGKYPLLVKVIQANDTLSVQVHPDDKMAKLLENENEQGKTECWFVLDAEPNAKLVYGLKGDFSNEELSKAINENRLENYLEYVNVQKGDFIFIPSGTVHAIGGGLRLLEVQQSCDLTYRLYDWGRGREVHIEKALKVIKNEQRQQIKPFEDRFECEYFSLEKINVKGGYSFLCSKNQSSLSKDFQLMFVISQNNAKIKNSVDNSFIQLKNEDIFVINPGEKITIEGFAQIMKISAK